jgi:hypothetical protein
MKPFDLLRHDAIRDARPDLVRKADVCARVLVEARRHLRAGPRGALLNQLAVRAEELLDGMDDILVGLDPVTNGPSFSIAARLHRELEQLHAAVAERRRNGVCASNVARED